MGAARGRSADREPAIARTSSRLRVVSLPGVDERLRCPVCSVAELTVPPYENYKGTVPPESPPPYEDWLGRASYEVCPSCGYEFGFDDNPGAMASGTTFEVYRREWDENGRPRFS
jgi:hypothetical protein